MDDFLLFNKKNDEENENIRARKKIEKKNL